MDRARPDEFSRPRAPTKAEDPPKQGRFCGHPRPAGEIRPWLEKSILPAGAPLQVGRSDRQRGRPGPISPGLRPLNRGAGLRMGPTKRR